MMQFLDKRDPVVDIKEALYARLRDAEGEEREFLFNLLDIIERS